MPGRLVHTNEVLVLLGDNWFVERTAGQARDIAARRLQGCREQLKSAEQAARLQSHWVEQGQQLQAEEGLDIVEEVSEEEYARQKERHREMVRAHRQQLRAERQQQQQHNCKKGRVGAAGSSATDPRRQAGDTTFDDVMRRLDALEDMEREEGSEDSGSARGSDDLEDDLSEESEEEETSDSDSDDDKETKPNRTAAKDGDEAEEEEEDSDDEDLEVDINRFKHVKIESPMPSAERKFQYSEADADEAAAGDDELGDMDQVEEVIRGRTRSFTRSVDDDHPRSDSKGRDSSTDSRTGGGGGAGCGPGGLRGRRVSWADQSPYTVSEDGGLGGVIKIRYVATPQKEGDEGADKKEEEPGETTDTVAAAAPPAEATPLVTVFTIPRTDPSPGDQAEGGSNVNTPADLVRLAGDAGADSKDKEPPPPVAPAVPDPPAPIVAPPPPTTSAAPAAAPRKPKKSILKRAPSQDGVADNVTGVSWLQSAESVPITNVYHHEPLVDPSSPVEQQPERTVPPAVKSRVVARGEAESTDAPATGDAKEPEEVPAKKMSKFKAGRLKQ